MSHAPPASVDELLARMVQHDTVNSTVSGRPCAEQPLVDWLDDMARAWGLPTERLPVRITAAKQREVGDIPASAEQLLITVEPTVEPTRDAAPWLLFDSHLDTVAVDGMTIDPFGGVVRDGKLLGRGACDTKGTGTAMLWALKEYAARDDRPNRVTLLFSVDEEFNMTGVDSFIANDLPRLNERFGGPPAAVIVGEPTMLTPVVAHNGLVRWRVTATGKAAHSSVPHLGHSAISAMARAIRAIEDEYIASLTATHPLTGKGVCSVTTIRGGAQVNIVPEHCEINIDRRLVPGESRDDEAARLNAALDAVRAIDPNVTLELHAWRTAPALDESSSAAALPRVQRVLGELGLPAKPIGAPFATHAGDLAAAGLPALVWGPGSPYPAHTKDEYVELDAIRQGVQAYGGMMALAR